MKHTQSNINHQDFKTMKNFSLLFMSLVLSTLCYGQWETSGNDVYIENGKVGIGTNSPGSNLDVVGTIRSTNYMYPTSGIGLELRYVPSEDRAVILAYDRDNSEPKNIVLNHTGGNVGIGGGQDIPNEKLVVNGNVLINDNNALILTSPNGTAFKIAVDDNGNLTTSQTTANKSIQVNYDIDIFPNPTDNDLTVTVNDQNIKVLDAEIYSLIGKMIFMKNYTSNSFQINTSDLSVGSYLLKLKDSDGNLIKTEKFIKQ